MNKKLLAVAVAGAMAAPMAAHAVNYKISGQVNRAVVFSDDGHQSDVKNVDNSASGSRFRFQGDEDLGNGMKVGMYYELQFQSADSGSFGSHDSADGNRYDIRQANVWFSGNWGKLTMGQGSGATHGITDSDLSGTGISGANFAQSDVSGGMRWYTSAGANTGVTQGSTHSNFDGFSRNDNIRYDSPALGPVTLSASVANDSRWEVAARVGTALGGGKLIGAVGYAEDATVDSTWGGSLAFMFSQGTNIQAYYSDREWDGGIDADSFGVKLGHKWGPHAVSIGYVVTDWEANFAGANSEHEGFQVGYVHSLKKANTQLYAGYGHNSLDVTGMNIDDHNHFVVGARVQFD